ncbi:MAG: DUF362 domain-containing protein [Spirochaetes bacterium]|nr:DUF362 domain-containing protein [Spirochaetota bacterium]
MEPRVAITRCPDYEQDLVDAAVRDAIGLSGGFDPRGRTVLLKPNMLRACEPDAAVTTHPAVLRAAIRACRGLGAAVVRVGDSPAFQSGDFVGDKSGLKAAAIAEGAQWVDFSDPVEIEVPSGTVLKRVQVARAVAEADLVVSLPKLKTHGLTFFTGAVKNLFGVVPGLVKAGMHLRFPGRPEFGAALVDIALAARPAWSIMDAVICMEGPGPNHGTPRRVGFILASPDVFALDWAAASMIGYDPEVVPYLADALRRGLFDPASVRVAGVSLEDARVGDFRLVATTGERDFLHGFLPAKLRPIVRNIASPRPFFSAAKCTACGGCVKICAAQALRLVPGGKAGRRVSIDRSRCVRCYCCDEICPSGAVRLSRRPW